MVCKNKSAGQPEKYFFHVFVILVIAIIASIIYSSILNGEFLFDDYNVIQINPAIRSLENIPEYFTQNMTTISGGEYYRPVLFVTYAIDYAISGLDSTVSYHVTNLIIHILACIALYFLLFLIFNGEEAFLRRLISAGGAIIFAVHPVNTEAVSYISSRSDILSTMFMIAAFAAFADYIKRRKLSLNYLGAALFGLALLSKEVSFVLPAVLLIYLIMLTPFSLKQKMAAIMPYIIVFCVMALVYAHFHSRARVMINPVTPIQYLGSQTLVVWRYIQITFLPLDLRADYNSLSFLQAALVWKLLAGGGILAILIYASSLARKNAKAAFCVFWYFLMLAPTSSLFPIVDVIFERRLYPALALVFPALLPALWHIPLFSRRERLRKISLVTFALIIILLFSTVAITRNKAYTSAEAFWTDLSVKTPDKSRAFMMLANENMKRHEYKKAEDLYKKSIALTPDDERNYSNLAKCYEAQGKIQAAEDTLLEALKVYPYSMAFEGRTIKLYLRGHWDLAEFYSHRAAEGSRANDHGREAAFLERAAVHYKLTHVTEDQIPDNRRSYMQAYLLEGIQCERLGKLYSDQDNPEKGDLWFRRAENAYKEGLSKIPYRIFKLPQLASDLKVGLSRCYDKKTESTK